MDAGARPPLDGTRLAAAAADRLPGMGVEVAEEVTSTNAVVAERARAGAPEGLVVVAEHQTAGRGRLDRSWQMPARAGLVFSVLLRPSVPARSWPWLPLLTGCALGAALRADGYAAGVKWPNDVLIGERKVAGILVERVETPAGAAAVVGVGLNVDLRAEELPVPTATSLALESGAAPDRVELLVGLLASLRAAYDRWQAGGERGQAELLAAYRAACVTLGRDVRVELPGGGVLLGRASGIDPDGRLVVAGPDGPVPVGAGDVVHVRPV
ncbi:biotin--[acetyl-CoA-carboxylase] ligase [Nocardioides pantholopis]|uniref:biotin--[acetyl-CoA-carboxylase] ligase n=1 Tax=Nocardioides pantholopis TaxID=2483798 RepID=UPI000F07FB7C|nr:biotin--[acetyl-CoA-carboxylase] ligase [Nocardioides pantholopis]